MHTTGILIIVFLAIFVLLGLVLGVYCHFCAESEGFGGGRYYGSDTNIGPRVVFVVKEKKSPANNKPRSRCKCSNKFKGSCKACQGEDFVDDGALGRDPDFSDFGGNKGLDPGWSNNTDPIRSVLGGTSGATGGVSSTAESGYADHSSSVPMSNSDQY